MENDQKDEYLDVCENIRHWENMRFAQLTLILAATAGLLSALLQAGASLVPAVRFFLKLIGLGSVVIFWVMDERVVQYWKSYRRRAIELESELGFQQHSKTPPRRVVTSGNAVRLLFALLCGLWTSALGFTHSL
jgi:hypothetical protein